MSKIHLYDYKHDSKIPQWIRIEENFNGALGVKCGFVRMKTTRDIKEVTCKLCIREYKKSNPHYTQ